MSTTNPIPQCTRYDVVIIGGAIMGSSAAWFLAQDPDFKGTILVIDRDLSFEHTSTAHTTSCIRQQFSSTLNVRISQYSAHFIKTLADQMGRHLDVPDLDIDNFGYLYLAADDAAAAVLERNHQVQRDAGAETELLRRDDLAHRYPFLMVDDICLGSINLKDEGYFDSWALFQAFRRQAQRLGAEMIENEVVAIERDANTSQVCSVMLKTGQRVHCGSVVNASGPRAAATSRMAGLDVPVEPRKRFSWVFRAAEPLDGTLPLTIDPSGVHVRQDRRGIYQAGGHDLIDPAVDYDDFSMNHNLWEDHIWPVLATRIPQFERVRLISEWAGHYAFNTFDQNAVIGPHPDVQNFLFMNGFSGHGLQQAPAMGRGITEWIVHGRYQSLDLTPFHFDRIVAETPMVETAVI